MRWIIAAAALALASRGAPAADAILDLADGAQRLSFSQSQLLRRRDLATITTTDSVYQHAFTRFKAIPIADLFAGLSIARGALIQFDSTDGFSATVPDDHLLGTDPNAARAYLAVEDPRDPWPPLAGRTESAGPFYLVWQNPQASGIGREEWPFQIASIKVLPDAASAFPRAVPAADAAVAVRRGFDSFRKNCLSCHKMNGDGAATIGPDLNLPMNPTEYFAPGVLGVYIRDPAGVRSWPGMIMHGFSAAAIPDDELADLIAYLGYMSAHKTQRVIESAPPPAGSPADHAQTDARLDALFGAHQPYASFLATLQADVREQAWDRVAAAVAYPIRIMFGGHRVRIDDPGAFVAQVNVILTVKVRTAIERQSYETLFANSHGAMIGGGELWFSGVCKDAKCAAPELKITAINPD